MKTIMQYSLSKERPVNNYPKRIISPPSPERPVAWSSMEEIAYKRYRSCGFTVRWVKEGILWSCESR